MCGLFGWSGLKPGVFNRDKFDKLGILNETRGKHSCGISIDGEIFIGVDGSKVYRDFLANNNDIKDPTRIPVVLGHTRHATGGAHNTANSHPFGFGTSKDGDFAFIGIHNGSLLNHKDLAKKFDVEHDEKQEGKKWGRDKIDSEILLEILYKSKNFKVLSEYNGAAALIWCFLDDPDTVYYYHGKSAKQEGDLLKEEERPLYYYKQSKNSLYVSSIEDSLKAIGAVENETLGEFEHNVVYKVVNGDIDSAEKFSISRAKNYQKTGGVKKNLATTTSTAGKNTTKPNTGTSGKKQGCKVGNGGRKESFAESVNIYDETPLRTMNEYKGGVYFNKLRYWRNGHRINGFWVYVEKFGFIELGEKLKDAESSFWRLVGKVFIKGEFKDASTLTAEEQQIGWIPFKNDTKNPIINPPIETFYDGVRIESPEDLVGCLNMESVGRAFDAMTLSLIAKHPVIELTYAGKGADNQRIYHYGELFTGKITPLGSDRTYDISEGNLVFYDDLVVVDNLIKEVEKLEETQTTLLLEEEARSSKGNFLTDDFMDNYLKTVFENPTEHLRRHKVQLQGYLPNIRAQRAIKIIEYVDNCVRNLLEVEEKE